MGVAEEVGEGRETLGERGVEAILYGKEGKGKGRGEERGGDGIMIRIGNVACC